jgi:hypothetical protein
MCDAGQMQQVFLNIINNAIDAVDEGGLITISTTPVDASAVNVVIRDNGHGIPRDVLKHIFEPFYTTKEKGKGTGLGRFPFLWNHTASRGHHNGRKRRSKRERLSPSPYRCELKADSFGKAGGTVNTVMSVLNSSQGRATAVYSLSTALKVQPYQSNIFQR